MVAGRAAGAEDMFRSARAPGRERDGRSSPRRLPERARVPGSGRARERCSRGRARCSSVLPTAVEVELLLTVEALPVVRVLTGRPRHVVVAAAAGAGDADLRGIGLRGLGHAGSLRWTA